VAAKLAISNGAERQIFGPRSSFLCEAWLVLMNWRTFCKTPGSLAEQWQDELYRRFHLPFEILTNDKLEAARTGNWFLENHLVIARLDKLSRDPDVQVKSSVKKPTQADLN
jgi:hypothetical protein